MSCQRISRQGSIPSLPWRSGYLLIEDRRTFSRTPTEPTSPRGDFHKSSSAILPVQKKHQGEYTTMRVIIALIVLSLCGATFAQDYRQWDEDKLREELGRLADITRKVNVPMRDGVHLSTDVYVPKESPDALPAVFWRTPYNYNTLSGARLVHALEAVRRGYAFVFQNERGRYFSEGEFEILGNPRTDGYDTLTWIAAQGWSNGRIGTIGCS